MGQEIRRRQKDDRPARTSRRLACLAGVSNQRRVGSARARRFGQTVTGWLTLPPSRLSSIRQYLLIDRHLSNATRGGLWFAKDLVGRKSSTGKDLLYG